MLSKVLIPALVVFVLPASLCSQTSGKNIGDGATNVPLTDPAGADRVVAVTISATTANPDTTVKIVELDENGEPVDGREWDLDGDGDGTGLITVPAGHTLVGDDDDSGSSDTDGAHVTISGAPVGGS